MDFKNNVYELFFIYGTLKKDLYNNHILKDSNAIFLQECKTKDKYPLFLLDEKFPYLQEEKGVGRNIFGELYLIPRESLESLDYFEGVPDLYYRGKIEIITLNDHIEKKVNTYFKAKKIKICDKLELIDDFKDC